MVRSIWPVDNFPAPLTDLIDKSLEEVAGRWEVIDHVAAINQIRILKAFQAEQIGEEDFQESSGYGYSDRGRDKLEAVFARSFQSEAALVRTQFVSGTHALTVALFALLRPGELLLSVTGPPYDTLQSVIGIRDGEEGTLREWGIDYSYLPVSENGFPDPNQFDRSLKPRVVYIQRSAGYELHRRSLTVAQIKKLVKITREYYPGAWVVVDNCYGEFVEIEEPSAAGADLTVGSLIKNPGGGLAPGGGYVVGSSKLLHKVAARLTAPGLYGNLGAVNAKRSLFQGLFTAPSLVGNALKNAVFAASLFSKIGYQVRPDLVDERGDIVQAVILGTREKLIKFCQAVQTASPVDSHLTLEPAALPGYTDPVIMAAGTFNQGASSEFSADAPVREPYAVFLQGGMTVQHALWATCQAARALYDS